MIIIYFSQSGTTKAAAEQLHSVLNVPIYQIEPVKAYPADFSELAEVTKLEVAKQVQPDLKRMAIDLPEDHKIILGFPTWRHQPPMLIERFFCRKRFKGPTNFSVYNQFG
ncbi:flavodoxin [Lentilactobacillus kisonensis]|uniref:flavodoxin n=1 Tax=Lentilactobacillus kisonensis TaxID=481722 RepID=UPI0006CF3E34|nr:flavodoxin [Lentilactobacillus kisonensis]